MDKITSVVVGILHSVVGVWLSVGVMIVVLTFVLFEAGVGVEVVGLELLHCPASVNARATPDVVTRIIPTNPMIMAISFSLTKGDLNWKKKNNNLIKIVAYIISQ